MTEYADVMASGAEGQANLNLWLKDVSVYVPGVHRSVLKRQLLLACREFFEQSWAWQQTLGPLEIVANQPTYMLSPFNTTTDVVGVVLGGVTVNGTPLSPLANAPAYPPDGNSSNTVNQPGGYYMLRPDVLAVAPVPTVITTPQKLRVLCALKPKISVSQVPRIAVTDFYDAIQAGVLYRLLNQPAKPYSNIPLSQYFESRFRTLIGAYAAKAKTGYNGAARWRFPYFGNPSRIGRGW